MSITTLQNNTGEAVYRMKTNSIKQALSFFSLVDILAVVGIFLLSQAIAGTLANAKEPVDDIATLVERGEVNLNPPVTEVPPQTAFGKQFRNPERVRVDRYDDHIMEAGISKDGNFMLWNDGPPEKDMHWAIRVSATHFRYVGPVDDVNKSVVDATPSFDLAGNLYYTSLVNYPQTKKSMYVGKFENGRVTNIKLLDGDIYVGKHTWFSLDPDSPDGNMLYYGELHGEGKGFPTIFNVRAAKRMGDRYVADESIVASLNSDDLDYAPAITADGREIFFTRTRIEGRRPVENGIYGAKRDSTDEPFGPPERVVAIGGPFVEAPTIALDGRSMYYHKREGGRHVLYRVTR